MTTPALNQALSEFLNADDTSPAARAAVAELLATVERLERTVATQAAQLAELDAVAQRLADAEQLVGSEREMALEISNLRRRNDELLEVLDGVYRSTSWKVTEPMRRAVDMARHTALDTLRQWRRG